MTEPEKLRLFFAARVPEEHLRAIEGALAGYRSAFPGARWAPVENQHVTLKFLGSTSSELLDGVVDRGRRAAAVLGPGSVTLGAMGVFPSRRRARVLWVGLEDPGSLLDRAAAALDLELRSLDFEPEARKYHAHLTLARFRTPVALPAELPEVAAGLAPFVIDELVLFRSRLHPKGARYEVVETVALAGDADGDT